MTPPAAPSLSGDARSGVPLMDCRRVDEALQREHDAAVLRVLRSGRYLMGEEVRSFEAGFAEFCGVDHVIGVSSGSDALELALRAVGCGPGAEVIVAPNAGMYASAATVLTGATPVYADVTPDALLMSPESAGRMVTDRTAAVVATHLFGRLCDVAGLRRVIGGRPIRIVEDCAQAHGAASGGQVAGSLGDLAAFSFYPTKNLGGVGDGGAVATNCPELAQAVRELAQYGWSRKFRATRPGGRNSRLDEIQAAVLNVRLPHVRRWNEVRRDIVRRYVEAAGATPLSVISSPVEEDACHLCVVRHARRDAAVRHFERQGVSTAIHYPILDHEQPALAEVPWRADDLSESLAARDEIFTVPCFPQLTSSEIQQVCRTIQAVPQPG